VSFCVSRWTNRSPRSSTVAMVSWPGPANRMSCASKQRNSFTSDEHNPGHTPFHFLYIGAQTPG
jgi:hypothetical protein